MRRSNAVPPDEESLLPSNSDLSESDEVVLDRDQMLHSTPVIVPRPSPVAAPPPILLASTNTAAARVGLRTRFSPAAKAQQEANARGEMLRHQSDSFLSTESTEFEEERELRKRSINDGDSYLERLSMEVQHKEDSSRSMVRVFQSQVDCTAQKTVYGPHRFSSIASARTASSAETFMVSSDGIRASLSSLSITNDNSSLRSSLSSSELVAKATMDSEQETSQTRQSSLFVAQEQRRSTSLQTIPATSSSRPCSNANCDHADSQIPPRRQEGSSILPTTLAESYPLSSSAARLHSTGSILNQATIGRGVPELIQTPAELWRLLEKHHIFPQQEKHRPSNFVEILCLLFSQGGTTPEVTPQQIKGIWNAKNTSTDLPTSLHASTNFKPIQVLCAGVSATITRPRTTPTTASPRTLVTDKKQEPQPETWPLLWQLPARFATVFLEILTRLITSETTEDYDRHVSLAMEERQRRSPRVFHLNEKPQQSNLDILYNVARLSGTCRNGGDENHVLLCLLRLVEQGMAVLEQNQPYYDHFEQILPPLAYLLGVWGSAGMTPLVLRRWLALIAAQNHLVKFRHSLVRSLIFCTKRSASTPPQARCFFSFQLRPSGGPALKRSIRGLALWPFRNDFGMATWFRAEKAQQEVVLLSVRTDQGAGWVVTLLPLKVGDASPDAYTLVVSVHDSWQSSPTHQLAVSGCVLLPRNWYHVGVRHTRSRLKGVFSLSTRQQLVVLLDGKVMASEAFQFPRMENNGKHSSERSSLLRSSTGSQSSSQRATLNLDIEAAVHMEGQMGGLYIFHENVSDASFRALYDATGGKEHRSRKRGGSGVTGRTASLFGGRSRSSRDTPRKQRPFDASSPIKSEDADVDHNMGSNNPHYRPGSKQRFTLSQNNNNGRVARPHDHQPLSVIDFVDPDHNEVDSGTTGLHQDLASIGSKVFVVWDPTRSMKTLAFELHIGAHVVLDDYASTWESTSTQNVIASIGGIEALIPVFRSMIAGGIAAGSLSILSNLFLLLAAFVHEHYDNAGGLLHCGGIDVIEQLLWASKRVGTQKSTSSTGVAGMSPSATVFAAHCANDLMASELVESLLSLRLATQHLSGLEIKVFSRLLFNLPLWLSKCVPGGSASVATGAALHLSFLPVLSFLAKSHPDKVRECVGTKDMVQLLRELASQDVNRGEQQKNRFLSTEHDGESNSYPLTFRERRHFRRVLLGMTLSVLASGSSPGDLGPLLRFISYNAELCSATTADEPSLRHQIQLEVCTVLLFLLQLNPPVPGLLESFTQLCGSIQAAAGWLVTIMVKPEDERLVALGIRCIFAYLRSTVKTDDYSVSLNTPMQGLQQEEVLLTGTSESSKTVALASSTVVSLAKGLASIGPSGRSTLFLQVKVTPQRVVYKLLWHLLKSHRSILGPEVRSALIYCMSDAAEANADAMLLPAQVLDRLIIHGNDEETSGCWFSYDVAVSMLQKSGSIVGRSLQNRFVVATVLRLLRYLPADTAQQWLVDLLTLVKSSRKSISLICSLDDWQSCLFHMISGTVEELCAVDAAKRQNLSGTEIRPSSEQVGERLDLSLELYATLLGNMIREAGDKSLDTIELTASLRRVCVNGSVVLLLIFGALCADLFDNGTILSVGSLTAEDWQGIDLEHDSLLLKQSAKLITDAILSKGTEGLDLNTAVKSWRSLRHLAEIIVGLVSESGLGVVDLFAYNKHLASAVDSVSGGLHGIRLPDTRLKGTTSSQYSKLLGAGGVVTLSAPSQGSEDARTEIDRRLCVVLAAQLLTILDAFIFPDSLDTSLPISQLHGLALVRNSEPRLGAAQGPLIASTIRLSFLLMNTLEPCSVRMLQCVSRLRSLLLWLLEIVRESSTQEGSPPAFEANIASMDRLLLAVVLHCHRSLGRCSALLPELESESASLKYFGSKESQKKHYRRLLRVALELRDIVATAYKGRNRVLKAALSSEAVEELRSSLEGSSAKGMSISREVAIKEFLSSRWVSRFQDVEIRGDLSIPEQVSMDKIALSNEESEDGPTGLMAVQNLARETSLVLADLEKALDVAFLGYLETQRQWAETESVRDVEYDGDATAKRLAEKHENDILELSKDATARRINADNRWNIIHKTAVLPWAGESHLKLADFADRIGRRTLLVRNKNFNSHQDAAYDMDKGPSSGKLSGVVVGSNKDESELTELIRRNAEAFAKHDVGFDDDSMLQSSDGDSTTDLESDSNDADSLGSNGIHEPTETEYEEDWDKIETEEIKHVDADGDVDGWARVFAWAAGEAVVARFEPVMIVSLQSYVEGKILLTTHGLYFRSTSNDTNVMTKQPVDNPENGGAETKDRQWRLSRLTEIHGRRHLLRQQAIELFFCDCHELFLNFLRGTKERDRFHAKLRNSCKTPLLWSPKSLNPRVVFRKSGLTELWRKRKISNFEYLMALNRMAGRTFNDITQYPVFPWVISDYTSESIDLSDSRIYRDLRKPIGALNHSRLAQLLERFKDLELFGFPETERFLYGSHYSSPGIVVHFLIRQEPFTTMAIELQSGRFDCPDRLFFDLAASWESSMTSTTDMKELVPEFFCLPEMFLNTNKFPLGTTQGGRIVNDVGLPPWANGSAHEFVRIHRQILESEPVSRNLNHWLDLVFGYKQRGEEAEAAHNVFHHLSYEGSVDLDKISDDVDRAAAESHIQNFGQTPSQLLHSAAHPERYSQEECWKPLIHDIKYARQLRCYTPSKQFGNMNSEFARGAVIKIHVLSDSILAIYGDMSIGSYRWDKHRRLRMDRLRPLGRRELSVARDAIKRGSLVPLEDHSQSFFANSNSFALTIGARAREELRRNAVLPSTMLMSGPETTIASAEASALLISCGFWDETVKAHNIESLRVLASESGRHQGQIRCLAVSYDGLMLTGGKDGTCRVWVVDHPDLAAAISDHGLRDSEKLLSCCRVLWGHDTPVNCLDLNSELDVAISGSQGGLVCVHRIRTGEFVRHMSPPDLDPGECSNNAVMKLALHTSGDIACYMSDKGLHVFTVNGVLLSSANAGEVINDMKICPPGEVLVTGGNRGKVVLRRLPDLVVCSILDLSKYGPIRSITLTPEELNPVSQFIFIGSEDGSITVVDRDPNAPEEPDE